MEEIADSIIINLPIDEVWRRMRDFSAAHNYVPGVIKTEIATPEKEGVGASRVVHANGGKLLLNETIIERDEGRGFTLRLHRGEGRAMPIFDEMYFRYAIEAHGEATLFKPSMIVKHKGLIGKLIFKVARSKMQQSVRDVAFALKEYYESGKPVTSARMKELKAV